MLLVLDIGNTAATCGLFKSGRLFRFKSLAYNDIPKLIKNCYESGGNESFSLIISSVVPKVTLKVKKAVKNLKTKVWVLGENFSVPIKHRYTSIKQLGADRILNIYGCLQRFEPPFLIVDYGTAITFDYVSKKGVFEGGLIIPGPELAFQALIHKAALLPKNMRLPQKAASFLGTNTSNCMKSGILQGYGAMTDGLIERFKDRYGPMKVIATGGFVSHLRPYTHSLDVLDPRLSVYSLHSIYKNLCSK